MKNFSFVTLLFLLIQLMANMEATAQLSPVIRLNQVGFYPNCAKVAIVTGNPAAGSFFIKSTNLATTYFTGTLGASATWSFSSETVRAADFSSFTTPGTYVLTVPGIGYSYTFDIASKVFYPATKGGIKALYMQRGSTAILAAHAGVYARAAGHPDNSVIILPSASSGARPAGTSLSSTKGWYDAGDYNSYIVNSGISTYTLLATYEHFKPYFDTLNLNIPESVNTVPDILDEIKWNLDWMLTMQDPNDGGVYNKKTCANFSGFVMPSADVATRYFCAKGTAATFDFAAVMATAYRIYKPFNLAYANQCLAAAQLAWTWGLANPNIAFNNPGASGIYPAVVTGGYGDGTFTDEKEWAANELYIATGTATYYSSGFNNGNFYGIPSWPNVRTLGLISLVFNRKNLTAPGFLDTANMKTKLLGIATPLQTHQSTASAYQVAMGQGGGGDFNWGSNSQAANQGMLLLTAFELNQNPAFCVAALSNLDYILGRNATNYSFVTGFGDNTPMHPHHRISEADGVVNPIPGWMVGGPQNSNNEGCPYALNTQAGRYLDDICSYSTNEIAINWNAPYVFLAAGIEYLMPCSQTSLPVEFLQWLAQVNNTKTELIWTTSSEKNSLQFSIERSSDGIHFKNIGTMQAKGFSNAPTSYSFSDEFPLEGISYYRILEEDSDGAKVRTSIISVERREQEFHLFPNPSNGKVTIENKASAKGSKIIVYNFLGELVYEGIFYLDEEAKVLDLSSFSKGVYSIHIVSETGAIFHKKLMLQ